MLELKPAAAEDLKASAGLLIKPHTPHDMTPDMMPSFYLPQLEETLQAEAFGKNPSKIIVLGVESGSGIVRAAYEFNHLNTFEVNLELRRGYIASEPEGRGFGSALLKGLMPILEQVAYQFGKPLNHLPETYLSGPTRFFKKHGYTLVGERDAGSNAVYYLKRVFEPKEHSLSQNEKQIVRAMMIKPMAESFPAMPGYAHRIISVAQPNVVTPL